MSALSSVSDTARGSAEGGRRPHPARSLPALLTLAKVEARLLAREPATFIFGLAFPALLIVALGKLIPGFDEPDPDMGGLRTVEIYLPVVLGLALCTVALSMLPSTLAIYRQNGVLRRLGTTPLPRSRLLLVQLVLQLTLAVCAAALATVSAVAVFDLSTSVNPLAFGVAFVCSGASLFGIGLLIAAVTRTGQAANVIGMATYFPMLFFAGVWVPREVMPDGLRTISDYTPSGAAVQSLQDAWFGGWPQPVHLIVLAVWFVVVGAVAAKLFRWE